MLMKYALEGLTSSLTFSCGPVLLGFVVQIESSLEMIRQSQQLLTGVGQSTDGPRRLIPK
jgi:hypothetical protein